MPLLRLERQKICWSISDRYRSGGVCAEIFRGSPCPSGAAFPRTRSRILSVDAVGRRQRSSRSAVRSARTSGLCGLARRTTSLSKIMPSMAACRGCGRALPERRRKEFQVACNLSPRGVYTERKGLDYTRTDTICKEGKKQWHYQTSAWRSSIK